MTATAVLDTPSHPTTPAASAPSTRDRRLVGVDATRGVALLGMIAVHSMYESDATGNPTLMFALFGGRAAATFAVMAGIGIAFMTGRRRVRLRRAGSTVAALVTRSLVIGAIGLVLGYTDASLGAVILPYYAVLFLLAVPLVFLPTWLVAVVGVAVAGGMPVLTHLWLPHLPAPTLLNPTVRYLVQHPLGLLAELAVTGEYPALPWLAYICAGLVIGRLTLGKVGVAVGLLATGVAMAVGAHLTSVFLLTRYGGLARIWAAQPGSVLTVPETRELLTLGGDGTTPTSTWWWLAVDAPHTSTSPDLVGTAGAAAALLGAMLLLARVTVPVLRSLIAFVQKPLAGAGSMTLTCYTGHIMFINSDYDTLDATTGYLVQVATVVLVGIAWRLTAGRGPLEGLVSALAKRARTLFERS